MRVVGQSIQVKFASISESLGAKVESKIGEAKVLDTSWKKKDLKSFMQGSLTRSNGNSGDGDNE